MNSSPYKSPYYCTTYQQYAIAPNKGAFQEFKEEFKTISALDWFSYVRKMRCWAPEFQVSTIIRKWLENDEVFCVTLSFIDCFFQREKTKPFPERIRFQRSLPNLRSKRIRKKYGKRIYYDAQYELRRMQGIAKLHCRSVDIQKIRAIKLATCAIYQMVRTYYVESAPRRISEELFQQLCDVVPATQSIYRRTSDGQYITGERYSIGHLLGQAGADVVVLYKLKRFSKYMRYFK